MDTANFLILLLAAMTAIAIGVSAVRYIFFSNGKDELNFEDDDAIYAFYGSSRRQRKSSKRRPLAEKGGH
ncbi:hypothetical protein ACHAQA_008208 [Verticillium albo-atrum]